MSLMFSWKYVLVHIYFGEICFLNFGYFLYFECFKYFFCFKGNYVLGCYN
jgi:hypothetical protein